MKYRVEYAFDVEAKNPREACLKAWEGLTGMGELPVGEVISPDGEKVLVDLKMKKTNKQEVLMPNQQGSSFDKECPVCFSLLGQEHTSDCWLLNVAVEYYGTDDVNVSNRSGIEKVDGGYWVEAWVYVEDPDLEDDEAEEVNLNHTPTNCSTCEEQVRHTAYDYE